ncbi:MAG: C1 family peptidase [Bacteroidota bacterium]
MKKQLLSAFTIFSTLFATAQEVLIQEAPLNPAFIEYQAKRKSNALVREVSREGFVLGIIPGTVVPDFTAYSENNNQKSMQTLPAVYDMRTNGKITPVKDQGNCGSCWLFPTMGAVESSWKVLGLSNFDLSEDNLKNCHGFDYLPCDGGNHEMATSYFSRSTGPYLETQDPYSATSTACPTGLTPTAYVSDARFLPRNKNAIKQALFDFGAVYNTFHWDDDSYNESDYTYYYSGSSSDYNHAVLIVGWDDTKVTAGGTGAWIIKNSWGASWGQNGFFYLSYNDTKAMTDATYYPARVDYNADAKISYYDHLGMTTSIGFGTKTGYGLVKFIPAANEQITKVGTWVAGSNAKVTIEIYNTLSGTLSSLMGSIPMKTCPLPGYYTFDLPSPISVTAGNDYYVKVKYNTPGTNYPVPVESKIADYTSNAVIETGKCWISGNGTSWSAVGSTSSKKYDVCVKVYTKTALCAPITSAAATPLTSNACIGGTTTFSVSPVGSGNTYQWKVSTNGGTTWLNLSNSGNYSNVSTSTLTVNGITSAFNNRKFRCIVSNPCSTVNSNMVTLTTNNTPVVTTQPVNKSIGAGGNTSFTFSATGTGKTYQWKVSTNGSTWTNLTNSGPYTNVTSLTLNITGATAVLSGKKYRCVVTNSCGTVNTNVATLTVSSTSQAPQNDDDTEHDNLRIMDENIVDIEDGAVYKLGFNYPNPFSYYTNVEYTLPEDATVTLEISNVLGTQIALLVNSKKEAGNYQIEFDGSTLPAGYYTYTLRANGKTQAFSQTRMMVIVRE